jgi:DNA polymerase I
MTLLSDTAYPSFIGEVEALNTTTIRRLIPSARHQLPAIARSAVLHTLSILADRRGIKIVAPVHDGFVAQGPASDMRDVSAALDRCMRDASACILRGYELPTSDDNGMNLIMPAHMDTRPVPQAFQAAPAIFRGRFFDKRGATMWAAINRLLNKLETKTA